jgi:hypothetical protein
MKQGWKISFSNGGLNGRVWGFRFQVWGFRFGVSGFRFGVSGWFGPFQTTPELCFSKTRPKIGKAA